MSRQIPLQIIRTPRSSLDTQASAGNLLAAEPYLLTDTNRLANGTSATSFNELLSVKTANTMTDVNQFSSGLILHAVKETVTVANSGAAYTIDLANGIAFDLTLTANCTLTLPSADIGLYFRLLLSQDTAGNRTVSFPATVAWVGNTAPTLSTSGGTADMLQFIAMGGKWLGSLVSKGIDSSIPAGDVWTERTSAGGRSWYGITSNADGTKLAVGVLGGYIYTSADGGATWTQRTSAGSRSWRGTTFNADGTKLAACAYGGYIYTSTDSGASWTQRTSAGSRNWYSITSNADGTKLAAVNYNSYIYTSIDSGATWTERTSAGSRKWYSITSSADGTKLAACVSGGYIYTSTDSGATWTERTSAGSRSWRGTASSADGTKLAASTYGGYIYTSTDSGASWTQRTSAGSRNWLSITLNANFTKLAACVYGGYIYTSP